MTASVRDAIPIDDEELLKRAVSSARERGRRGSHLRWVAVADTFSLGSTYSQALCRRFGFDPDERVRP